MDRIVKILFINSDESEYLLIAALLSETHHTDYQLVWHPRLEGALQAILADDYDLVLLDYYWGDRNARELIRAAKSQASQAPIVVMTEQMEAEVDQDRSEERRVGKEGRSRLWTDDSRKKKKMKRV